MAEVDVRQRSSKENREDQPQGRGMTRQGQGGSALSRSRGGDPLGFSLTPFDMLTASPFSLMRRMSEEMDRTLARLTGQAAGGGGLSTWVPAIEVAEREGQLQVQVELPGMRPDEVRVEITDDALAIQGERREEREENQGGMYRSERRYGRFYREIPLPEGANPEQARAQFNNGVLEITIPVAEQSSNRRQIPVSSGTAGSQQASSGQQAAGSSQASAASTSDKK
jgi:HSP20 family protein